MKDLLRINARVGERVVLFLGHREHKPMNDHGTSRSRRKPRQMLLSGFSNAMLALEHHAVQHHEKCKKCEYEVSHLWRAEISCQREFSISNHDLMQSICFLCLDWQDRDVLQPT